MDVIWDMAMVAENRLTTASTELEGVRKELADLKLVVEARCADYVHLESAVQKLIDENGVLKRRLKIHDFDTVVCVVLLLFASGLILWYV